MLLISLIALVVIGLIILFSTGSGSGKANVPVTIPDVVGKTRDDATAILKAQKLQVTVTEQSNNANEGTVLSQNPQANSQGHQDDVVQLTVSSGPQPIQLDDYTGQSADTAKSDLQKKGLKVEVNQQASDTVSANTVISQSPSADQQVTSGATVTLTVSSGPAQVAVPNDLVGYTISSAAQKLSDAGLRTSYPDSASSSDIVASTDPAPGTKVAPGSTVVLTPQVTTTSSSSSTSTTSTTSKTKKTDPND